MSMVNQNSIHAPPQRRLEGKVAIITGGAADIGQATARLFHLHGAKVIIADIADSLGESLSASLSPTTSLYVHCDVTSEPDVRAAVDLAVSHFGKLDIMFNNAGVLDPLRPRISDVQTSDFEHVLAVNVTGVFLGTKHAARVMSAGGSIINNGSVGSVVGGVASHAYVASKHAVVGLTRSAAAEVGRRGVRVNCVSPFAVASSLATGFSGLGAEVVEGFIGRIGCLKGVTLRAEDVAEAALFLAGDESRYVNGHNLVVDGGFTVVNNAFGIFDAEEGPIWSAATAK